MDEFVQQQLPQIQDDKDLGVKYIHYKRLNY